MLSTALHRRRPLRTPGPRPLRHPSAVLRALVAAMAGALALTGAAPAAPAGAQPLVLAAPGEQVPYGVVDRVTAAPGGVTVKGWALDPDTSDPIPVHVYVGKVGVAVTADGSRPDVAAAYGHGDRHGFTTTVPAAPGRHAVCVYAINHRPGVNPLLGCRDVVVENQTPYGVVDRVTTTDDGVTVTGWALDPDTSDPIPVHVYVGKVGVAVTADGSRPDVAAAYGHGDRHGFTTTVPAAPGRHAVCVYAINHRPGVNPLLGCRDVVVGNQTPYGVVDRVTAAPGGVTVKGWALDPDTSDPIPVHVYVGKVGVAVTADGSRPDVAAAYGHGDRHGFTTTVPAAPGRHAVCVYAINHRPGVNPLLGCRDVVVENQTPYGVVDRVTTTDDGVTVTGWALDPDTSDPIPVHVYVGKVGVAVTADGSRPDVAAAYGHGDRHGFTTTVPAAPGRHAVCVYAINHRPGVNPLLGCRDVVVEGLRDPYLHPFGSSSPWNTAIGSGAQFEPAHGARTAALRTVKPVINRELWSIPVRQARATDPLVTLEAVRNKVSYRIRIPADTVTTGGTDGHVTIVSPDGVTSYDAYKLVKAGPTLWRAQVVTVVDLRTSGIAAGVRAAATPGLAGLIRAHEVRDKHIPHALAIAVPNSVLKNGPVWPAKRQDTDGARSYAGTVPMGTLFAIPGSVDVAALPVSPEGKALARALQDYGAYVVDRAGTAALYCELACDAAATARMNAAWKSLFPYLRAVTNSSPTSVGGGGAPRVAAAPTF